MKKIRGFTIVELLVVIVVIGILTAIAVVSYVGISKKATAASLQSDLENGSKQLKIFSITNGEVPTTTSSDCASQPDTTTNKCLKTSGNNVYGYKKFGPNNFMLVSSNGNTCYSVTEDTTPTENCVTIGTQTWMKYNLGDGNMIAASASPSNNQSVENYCYNDTASNCKTFGGFYTWDEMMGYVTTEPNQGICPTGFHIPTSSDWDTLSGYLGGDSVAGGKLVTGGSTGFNALYAGEFYPHSSNPSTNLGQAADYWTSTEDSSTDAHARFLTSDQPDLLDSGSAIRNGTFAALVRCIKN